MSGRQHILIYLFAFGWIFNLAAQEYTTAPVAANKIVPPTPEWVATITELAPSKPTIQPIAPRKILLFSLTTGYQHKVIPHTAKVVQLLGEKSGAYTIIESTDIEQLTTKNLATFDAVVLNNTCPRGPDRNLFADALPQLPENERNEKAAALEKSLIDFVQSGKGLVVLHGAITFQNNSPEVSKMIGGSFDFHPSKQWVTIDLVDPTHPLVAGFKGKGFIHIDEPYLFKNAYKQKNFRPLLVMDMTKLNKRTQQNPKIKDDTYYIAWVKKYGKGRVFFCSPSHQPESYETPVLLQFILDGIQYALGDLPCDDSPIGK